MSLNLEKQLRFYGAYHHNPVNIGIHVVCVPLILWTGILLGTNSPTIIPIPSKYSIPNLPLNLGVIYSLACSILYLLMEPVAGGIFGALLLASTALANHVRSEYGMTANYVAIGVHVVCWIAQFIGHGKFEGRAPALMDNLVQAIFLAPLFVWLEILFVLGYRPELKTRLEKFIEQDIAKFRQSKVNGRSNGGPVTGNQTAENGTTKTG